MIPVRMAATAVTVMTTRPAVPMMDFAAKNVGTAATPFIPSRPCIYAYHDPKPSGTEEMPTYVIAM